MNSRYPLYNPSSLAASADDANGRPDFSTIVTACATSSSLVTLRP